MAFDKQQTTDKQAIVGAHALMKTTEVPEIQDVEGPKSIAPPPYRSNHWAKLDHIWARDPSGESIKGHRSDF